MGWLPSEARLKAQTFKNFFSSAAMEIDLK
jgi:hypothetical protein